MVSTNQYFRLFVFLFGLVSLDLWTHSMAATYRGAGKLCLGRTAHLSVAGLCCEHRRACNIGRLRLSLGLRAFDYTHKDAISGQVEVLFIGLWLCCVDCPDVGHGEQGDARTRFQSPTVPFGEACEWEVSSRLSDTWCARSCNTAHQCLLRGRYNRVL